jgi:hypothetical protein
MSRETQAEVDAVRESFEGELERKAARIAQLEQLVDETHLRYRSTMSWKVTAPLRAVGRIGRALRRSGGSPRWRRGGRRWPARR